MSSLSASFYGRISEVLYSEKEKKSGLLKATLRGDIEVKILKFFLDKKLL